nr:chloramphenicol acetyltransferase [Bacteroidales bacterium]
MKQEINPKETNRAYAFEMWLNSPMPMVTLTKTFNVTRLHKMCKRRNLKFNMLLCWCIGKTASGTGEFYLLPE